MRVFVFFALARKLQMGSLATSVFRANLFSPGLSDFLVGLDHPLLVSSLKPREMQPERISGDLTCWTEFRGAAAVYIGD